MAAETAVSTAAGRINGPGGTSGHSGTANMINTRKVLLSLLQVAVTAGLLVWLVNWVGIGPFQQAVESLTASSVAAALAIGAVATLVQARRWRLVSRGYNIQVGHREAVAKCWQAGFLNSVLPGGLAGDAVRAAEQRKAGSWSGSIGSVLGERLVGTAVIFAAATFALYPVYPYLGILAAAITIGTLCVSWPSLRKLAGSARWEVFTLAVAGWVLFATLFLVAAGSTTATDVLTEAGIYEVFAMLALTLAGMSVPLSLGGWGPREGAAALVFPLFGSSAEAGVAVAFNYGILALITVFPGAVVLLYRLLFQPGRKLAGGGKVEIGADVLAKTHPARGGR